MSTTNKRDTQKTASDRTGNKPQPEKKPTPWVDDFELLHVTDEEASSCGDDGDD